MLKTFAHRALKTLAALAAVLVVAYFATVSWGDAALYPAKAGDEAIPIHIVSHGYHAGLVVETAQLAASQTPALAAIGKRFHEYRWLEIGWGDEGFYRNAATLSDVGVGMALRALLMPGNPSVLHIVGLSRHPAETFAHSDVLATSLSRAGFARLAEGLEATFRLRPDGIEDLGPGLYGPSLFYRAEGSYSIIANCNHWVGRLLRMAGVPGSGLAATTAPTLMEELRRRGGAVPAAR